MLIDLDTNCIIHHIMLKLQEVLSSPTLLLEAHRTAVSGWWSDVSYTSVSLQ